MANVTANREGWTGFLIPDKVSSVTATSEQGAHVGPAVPATSNNGNMVLRTLRTDRVGSEAALTLAVSHGGQAMASIPAEIIPTYDGRSYGWMDPVICWSFDHSDLSTDKLRLSRWGGPRGFIIPPVYSSDLLDWILSNEHDICAAGDDELLMVRVDASTIAFTAVSSIYKDGYFLGPYLSPRRSQRQTIDTDVLSPVSHVIVNVRCAVANGSGLLIIQARETAGQDRLYQFASTDGGQSWEYVDSTGSTVADSPTGIADIEASATGFIFAYADQADTSQELRLGRVTSPFEPIWTASYTHVGTTMWDDSTSTRVNAMEWALCSSETGEIYLTGMTWGSTEHRGLTFRSQDGQTWERLQGANGWIILDTAYSRPTDTDAVWSQGGINWVGLSASERWIARLGGWSEYAVSSPTFLGTLPTRGAPNAASTCGWTRSYVPLGFVPADVGWTLASAGASTDDFPSGSHLRIIGSGASRTKRSWEIEGTTVDVPTHVMFGKIHYMTPEPMVGLNSPVIVEFCASNGVKSTALRFSVGYDSISIYYKTGASTYALLDTVAHGVGGLLGTTFFFWVSFDLAAMGCQYSAMGSYAFTYGGAMGFDFETHSTITGLTDIFASDPLTKTTFGACLLAGEETDIFDFHCHDSIVIAPAKPTLFRQGRPLSGPIVHFPEALIQVAGGVAAVNDSWVIETGHEKAIENVLSPDPGLVWRSGDVAENVITVTLDKPLTGPMMGLLLKGIVAEDLKIEGHVADSATWVEVVSYGDALIKLDATRTLTSPILRPATATTGETPHLRENELAGCWMTLGWEGRQILDNRSGHWVPGYGSHPPTIRFDGASIAETGGVMQVMPKDLVLLVWLGDAVIDQVRITFAASAASIEHDAGWPSGTSWELQRVIVGPVIIAGDDPDWGRTVRTSVPTQVQTLPSGRVRPKATLPARREMDIAWTDGIDTRGLSDDSVDPDYFSAETGGHALADVGTTPWTMEGLISRIQGEAGEVVCFRVGMGEMTEGSGLILNRRHEFIHGRITSVVSHDSVLGEEDVDQVLRLGTITIREEV